jgi:hypothetical protein
LSEIRASIAQQCQAIGYAAVPEALLLQERLAVVSAHSANTWFKRFAWTPTRATLAHIPQACSIELVTRIFTHATPDRSTGWSMLARVPTNLMVATYKANCARTVAKFGRTKTVRFDEMTVTPNEILASREFAAALSKQLTAAQEQLGAIPRPSGRSEWSTDRLSSLERSILGLAAATLASFDDCYSWACAQVLTDDHTDVTLGRSMLSDYLESKVHPEGFDDAVRGGTLGPPHFTASTLAELAKTAHQVRQPLLSQEFVFLILAHRGRLTLPETRAVYAMSLKGLNPADAAQALSREGISTTTSSLQELHRRALKKIRDVVVDVPPKREDLRGFMKEFVERLRIDPHRSAHDAFVEFAGPLGLDQLLEVFGNEALSPHGARGPRAP